MPLYIQDQCCHLRSYGTLLVELSDNYLSFIFQSLVQESLELNVAPEIRDRFFGPGLASDPGSIRSDPSVSSTCETRIGSLPAFTRIRNLFGKLLFLAQGQNMRQHVEVIKLVSLKLNCFSASVMMAQLAE